MTKEIIYKSESSIWFDKIPQDWHISKFKFLVNIYTGNSLNDSEKLRFSSDENPHLQGYNYISSKDIDVSTSMCNYDTGIIIPSSETRYKVAPSNSTLLCIEGGSAGRKITFTTEDVCFVNKLACFKSTETTNAKFVYYFLQSNEFKSQFQRSLSGLIGGVSRANLNDIEVPVPPISEQSQIIAFLDRKTAQIDTIIEKKQKLLQLLDEKKKSVINEAVTGQKIWDGNAWVEPAEVKDSGMEWIGEIPVDWQIKKLKYLVDSIDSGCSVNAEEISVENESEYGVLKTSCVSNYFFNSNKNKKVFAEEYSRVKCPVTRNTIIVSRMNTPELVGASGYVEESHSNLFLPDRLWQLNFLEEYKDFVKYISYILSSDIYRGIYSKISTGSSPSMQNISQSSYIDLEIIFPPTNQIPFLIKKIEETNNQIILIDKKLNLQIDKLQEYRQSIISEAVTGKIDI